MLVLSRMRDESIMIGDHIELIVLDIRGDKVRLGTKAARNISVHRKECVDPAEIKTVQIKSQVELAAHFERAARKQSGGMLVLSRMRDETIIIDGFIEIAVVDIRGDKVRLGITAPPQLSVHRKEVYEAIRNGAIQAEDISARSPDTRPVNTHDNVLDPRRG